METKCPNCGEILQTKSIQKKIGLGSIDYPIAQICPKCHYKKDLTGAGQIIAKPVFMEEHDVKKAETGIEMKPSAPTEVPQKPQGSSTGINSLIPILLAILVVGAIAWVFFINPTEDEPIEIPSTETATPPPTVTSLPPANTSTPAAPEATASGRKVAVSVQSDRGFTPSAKTIKIGDEVIWTNEGTYMLTLSSSDGLFEDFPMNMGKTKRYVFTRTGTYNFSLKGKENLEGMVIVES